MATNRSLKVSAEDIGNIFVMAFMSQTMPAEFAEMAMRQTCEACSAEVQEVLISTIKQYFNFLDQELSNHFDSERARMRELLGTMLSAVNAKDDKQGNAEIDAFIQHIKLSAPAWADAIASSEPWESNKTAVAYMADLLLKEGRFKSKNHAQGFLHGLSEHPVLAPFLVELAKNVELGEHLIPNGRWPYDYAKVLYLALGYSLKKPGTDVLTARQMIWDYVFETRLHTK